MSTRGGYTRSDDGATITAACANTDGLCGGASGGSVTINKPAHTTYGDGHAAAATMTSTLDSSITAPATITYTKGGTPLEAAPTDAGTYTASITLGDATASVVYTIAKAAPTASDFTFAAPAGLTYDGNAKTATVKPNTGINGMGAVTVKYYQDDKPVEKPTNAGKYIVKISVKEGTNYNAAADLKIGELIISKGTLDEGANKKAAICYSDTGVKTYTRTDFGFSEAGTFALNGSVTEGRNLLASGYPKFENDGVQVQLATGLSLNGGEKKVVIPMTFTPDGGNYKPKEVTLTITLADKATNTSTMKVTQADFVYGERTVAPQVTGVEGTPTFTYKERDKADAAESGTAPTNAGKYTVTAKIDTADTIYTASADFEIMRKPLTQDMVKLDETVHTYNGTSQTVTVTVTDGSITLKDNQDYSMSGFQKIPAGTHTVVVTGLENYTGEISKEWKITPAPLTIKSVTLAAKTYDGTKTATVESVNFGGLVNSGTLTKGDDYTATGEFEDANAGDNKNVTVTVTLNNTDTAKNYTLKDGNAFKKTGVTITQAEAPAAPTGLYGIMGQKLSTVDLPAGWTWTAPETEMSDAGENKTFTAKYHDEQGNYKDASNVSVTVAVKNKVDVSSKINFPDGEMTYGPAKALTYENATIDGIEAGTDPKWTYTYAVKDTGELSTDGKPKTAGTYTVTAAYEDSKYIGRATAVLHVKKIKPTGEPIVKKITEDNKTLADASLNPSTGWPTGTIKWVTADGSDLSSTTKVEAGKEYKWVYTPNDTANYETLTGMVVLYAKSAPVTPPGGSSAATPSVSDRIARELKNAKEGSTVTIDMKGETKLPVSTTKEIAGKDVTVELDMGGGMVWSFNGLDVPKGGVSLNLGVKTGTKTIPTKVINALTGETTTIQLQLDHNGSFGMSLKLSVDLDKKHDGLYANLYFYNPKSGELEFQSAGLISGGKASWVFDHASDYAIVIDKESHEPMTFTDVPDTAYYAEAVNWAVAKKITGGVGNKLFAPNAPCTRAQIVTFLWRAAGSPGPKTMSGFSDVPADSYYAKAVAWAVENGITGGTGDGKFSPDATCTRAQAVTFLYRASGMPAVSGNAAFSDVATNAYYAAAVKWAEKNGITGGIGGGLFGSDNNCTRAQIVTFLYRSYQSK